VDLRVPRSIGGTHYLRAVTVGRDPDDETVRDCPVCGGLVYDDDWHLAGHVVDVRDGTRRSYRCCSEDCLRSLFGPARANSARKVT
jgi:hypothetical protein